jgi:hypothetical protein
LKIEWNAAVANQGQFIEQLKDCDACIATGSDNSARYFEYYFGRDPSLSEKRRIRIELTADDSMQYVGLAYGNVMQVLYPGIMMLLHKIIIAPFCSNHQHFCILGNA